MAKKTPGQEKFKRRQKDLQKEFLKGKTLKQARVAIREKKLEPELAAKKREEAGSPTAIAQKSIDIKKERRRLEAEEILEKKGVSEKREELAQPPEEEQSLASKFLFGDKDIDVIAGTVPIGLPAGRLAKGAAKGAQAAKTIFKGENAIENLLKGNPLKGLEPAKRAIRREFLAKKISDMANIRHDAAIRLINSYNKWSKSRLLNFLTSKPVKVGAVGTFAVASADTIWTWYALDNIATGLPFMIPNIEEALQIDPDFTLDDALDLFDEADLGYELALAKVDQSARYNPLTWSARKLIVFGAKLDKAEYDLRKRNFQVKFGLV